MNAYNAIIIGAGHNGMAAAFYLAKAGMSVLVLEQRSTVGGTVSTEELQPGFHYSRCAYDCSLLNDKVYSDLQLEKHGLKLLQGDPLAVSLGSERHLIEWRDPAKFAAEIAHFSKKDAEQYPKYVHFMDKIAKFMREVFHKIPPDIASSRATDFLDLTKYFLELRKVGKKDMLEVLRIPPMSARDFLDEWFENPQLKALIAARAFWGNSAGPYSPGTAFLLLYQAALSQQSHFRAAHPEGGMGNLAKAMELSLKERRVEIRTDAQVKRIIIENGKAEAVELANGERLEAAVVVCNADPKTTFNKLVEARQLSPKFREQMRKFKMKGVTAKVNFALQKLPPLSDPQIAQGHMYIAPSLDYIEQAFDATKYGNYSQAPVISLAIPSVNDPSLAPAGQHVAHALVQYAPYSTKEGWQEQREKFLDVVVDTIERHLKGFCDSVIHKDLLLPMDIEQQYGIFQGHILHGDHSLDQMFLMRPTASISRYSTPIKNLYLCGGGTHPGGGVTGIPGYNAAKKIIQDRGK